MKNERINSLLNGMPPSSIDAEKCLLGAIMINPIVLEDIYWNYFSRDAFYKVAHKTIFILMLEAKEKNKSLEIADFHTLLEEKKLLEAIGGSDALLDIVESNPSGAQAEVYASFIMHSYAKRRAIDIAGAILFESYKPDVDITIALEDAALAIEELIHDDGDFVTFVDIFQKKKGETNGTELHG